MGLHSFCCRVRQGTDGEVFSPGRPSQGEKGGGGEHPKPQPPTKIPPVPPLPPDGAGPAAGAGRALAAASRAGGLPLPAPPRPGLGPRWDRTGPASAAPGVRAGSAGRLASVASYGPATSSRPEAGRGGDFSA